jgi:hypothetical protein
MAQSQGIRKVLSPSGFCERLGVAPSWHAWHPMVGFGPKHRPWRHHGHVPWDTTTSDNRMYKATDHTANGRKEK